MKLRNLRAELVKILHLQDTPNVIALSVAIGVFWNFIPVIGLGVILSILLARLLKVSVVTAVTVHFCTVFFIPFFYTLNVITGRLLTGINVNLDEISKMGDSIEISVTGIEEVIVNPKSHLLYDMIHSLSIDFVIGSIVNAFLAAGLIYITLWFVIKNRRKYKKKKQSVRQKPFEVLGVKIRDDHNSG